MKLPYEDLVDEPFIRKVVEVSAALSIKPEWLMVTMAIETARTFSANIQNPYSKAVGLIQFMPKTAIALGTTVEELKKMDRVEQMGYVLKYFLPYKGKMKSFDDVYLCVFYPAAVGKPDGYILGLSPKMQKKIAIQNPAYDRNKDAIVQKWEVREAIRKFIPQGYSM